MRSQAKAQRARRRTKEKGIGGRPIPFGVAGWSARAQPLPLPLPFLSPFSDLSGLPARSWAVTPPPGPRSTAVPQVDFFLGSSAGPAAAAAPSLPLDFFLGRS